MALPRPSHYKEVFTPALHRRFTGSALVAFILCYLVGILMAEKSSRNFHTKTYVLDALLMGPSLLAMVSPWICYH